MEFDKKLQKACEAFLRDNYPELSDHKINRVDIAFDTDEYMCSEGTCEMADTVIYVSARYKTVPDVITGADPRAIAFGGVPFIIKDIEHEFRGYSDLGALAVFMKAIDPYMDR